MESETRTRKDQPAEIKHRKGRKMKAIIGLQSDTSIIMIHAYKSNTWVVKDKLLECSEKLASLVGDDSYSKAKMIQP